MKCLILLVIFVALGFGLSSAVATTGMHTSTILGINIDDPGDLISGVVEAAKKKEWVLFAGFLLLIVTFLVDRILKQRIPKRIVPWLSVILGVASQVALYMATGRDPIEGVIAGVVVGLLAVGSYDTVGKHIPYIRRPKQE